MSPIHGIVVLLPRNEEIYAYNTCRFGSRFVCQDRRRHGSEDAYSYKLFVRVRINSLYESGNYRAALDSITVLRDRYPAAIEARKAALVVWQNASLKMAQADVAQTDILLQQTIAKIASTTDRYERNMLGVKRDSLQARYDAMCGVVKMIRMRQKQEQKQ